MILGIHGLLYSSDPEATRAFFRDVMELPGNDIGEGWWIFDFAEGDLGVHPVDDPKDAGLHDVSFFCDDLHATVAELKQRGVEFTGDIEERGYGLVTYLEAPGGITVQLYEPHYQKGSQRAKPRKATGRKASTRKATSRKANARRAAAKPAKGGHGKTRSPRARAR